MVVYCDFSNKFYVPGEIPSNYSLVMSLNVTQYHHCNKSSLSPGKDTATLQSLFNILKLISHSVIFGNYISETMELGHISQTDIFMSACL